MQEAADQGMREHNRRDNPRHVTRMKRAVVAQASPLNAILLYCSVCDQMHLQCGQRPQANVGGRHLPCDQMHLQCGQRPQATVGGRHLPCAPMGACVHLPPTQCRGLHPLRKRHRPNSKNSPWQDVSSLNEGRSTNERLSSEVSASVSDVVDTDRTAELLLWLWDSIFKSQQAAAPSAGTPAEIGSPPKVLEMCVFGGGCFWCLDAVFRSVAGVHSVTCGYAGGTTTQPTYQQVCSGTTGHAEVVQVVYDPSQITYTQLLRVFFSVHDASSAGRQGDDVGSQYCSIIVCTSQQQHDASLQMLRQAEHESWFPSGPPVTRVLLQPPAGADSLDTQLTTQFWPAEPEHQDYMSANSGNAYCARNILPKLRILKTDFPSLVAEEQL